MLWNLLITAAAAGEDDEHKKNNEDSDDDDLVEPVIRFPFLPGTVYTHDIMV